jgi:hypothetical protein
MTKKKAAQSHKTPDPAAFAEAFMKQWQAQWQELLQQKGMPHSLEEMGLPPGFIPLQNMGPMGLMAPMGAVAMANLKMLQDLQARILDLETVIGKSSAKKPKPAAKKAKSQPKKKPKKR